MEEISRITIYLGVEEYPLEFITLEPMSMDDAELITEIGEDSLRDVDPEKMDASIMEEKLADFYENIQMKTDVELFCPMFEKETIATIEHLLENYDR